MSINFSLVLPCYNEEDNVLPLYKEINELPLEDEKCEIVFVNNGSYDDTEKKIDEIISDNKNQNIIIKKLNLKKNRGYGGGIWEGVKVSSGEYLGWTHADLQTPLIDCLKLYRKIQGRNKIFGKGYRTNDRGFDGIISRFHEHCASIILGYRLRDINAQPKIFSKDFINYLTNVPNSIVLDTYATYVALENKFKIETINVNFKNRIYGESKWKNRLSTFFGQIISNFFYLFKLRLLKTKNDPKKF